MLLPNYTALDRASEYLRAVRVVRVTGWPLCSRCLRIRRIYRIVAGLLFFGGLAALSAAFIVGGLMDGDQPMLLLPILAGFAAILLSAVPLARCALPRLTRIETTSDGTAVRITGSHPEFVARLDARARARHVP
jgi:hypothetical protein